MDPLENLNFESITQMIFSIGVAWYLLAVFSKKLDVLAKLIEDSAAFSEDAVKMFTEIKDLIKETSTLVTNTSESVKIMSELTKSSLRQLEEARWQNRREREIIDKKSRE